MPLYDGNLEQQRLDCLSISDLETFGAAYKDARNLLPMGLVNITISQGSTDDYLATTRITVSGKKTGRLLYTYSADGWYCFGTDKTFQSLREVIEDETIYPKTEDEGEEGQLSLSIRLENGQVYYETYLHLCPITLEQLLGKLGVYLVSNIDYHNDGVCTLSDIFHSGGYPYWRESFRACSVDSQGNLEEFTLSIADVITREEATNLKVQQPFTSESIAIALEKFIVLMRKVKNALDAKATVTTTGTILVEFS